MKDDAVSTVLATILLFGIIVLAAGTFALFAAEEITRKSESGPYVMFQESSSPNYLYHAGGDSLLKDEIRIYAKKTQTSQTKQPSTKNHGRYGKQEMPSFLENTKHPR